MFLNSIIAMWMSGVDCYMGAIPARVMTGISLGFEISVFIENRFGNGSGMTLQVISASFAIEGVLFDIIQTFYIKSTKTPWLQRNMGWSLFFINISLTLWSVFSLFSNVLRDLLLSRFDGSNVKLFKDCGEILAVVLTVGAMICKILNLSDLLFAENPTLGRPTGPRVPSAGNTPRARGKQGSTRP